MCLLVYILTNVVGIVDIWLHAVTTTIIQPTTTPLDTPFKFGVDQVLCPPYPDPWYEAISPCLMQSGGWGGGVSSKIPGMLVTANNSDSLETITLADANDMAILVKPNIPRDLMFRARSFGARASCQSINHLCKENPVVNCTGFPSTFPPYNALKPSGSTQLTEGDSRLFIQSSNCPWDIACPHVPSDQITNVAATLNSTVPPVNAYNLWMQFAWEAEGDQDYGLSQNVSDAIGSYSNVATMLSNCTLYFYNVTVDYNNGSYLLVDEELSNVGLSDGLGAPARLGHFASHLISNIEGRAFTDTSTGDLMTYLQQDLSRLALGSAAVITNISTDTLFQSSLGSVIVGRYPFWPIVIFLALLYLLAALALVLFLVMMISNRAESVVFRGDSRDGGGRQMSILELTQMRLRSPLCLVAALFPPQRNETDRGALSIETDELNLFDEKSNDERIQVGLHSKGSEFGVFREQLWQSEEDGRWTKPRTQMKELN
ncbi:hypothetical protein QCA50_007293 [Cerrena zonata]|uniref:Uncharacterized protein n=1 Tax=Cerrena zonata TaxID=2478898 RepID=A0AAW0G9M2_9APHY